MNNGDTQFCITICDGGDDNIDSGDGNDSNIGDNIAGDGDDGEGKIMIQINIQKKITIY